MRLECTIYCEAPDCGAHTHVGVDRISDEGRLDSYPMGFLRLSEWDNAGRHDYAYCSHDCLMKAAAQLPPPVRIEWDGPTTETSDDT